MPWLHTVSSGRGIRPVDAVLRSAAVSFSHESAPKRVVSPFVTISRQAGAGGNTVARALVARLNELDPQPNPWTCWDQELVRRISETSHVPEQLIEALEEQRAGWLLEVLSNLGPSAARTDEYALAALVSKAVCGLAAAGRVVIVGRGGAYLTRGLPGGVHVRLVAPLEWRIEHMARQPGVTPAQAARQVAERDRLRDAFYRRHWPGKMLNPDDFDVTFNSARVPFPVIVECITSLVREKSQQLRAVAAAQEQHAGA